MATTVADLEGAKFDLVEASIGPTFDLLPVVSSGGMGSSLLSIHREFMAVSGGAPRDVYSEARIFGGHTPSTTYRVPLTYKNPV